VTEFIAGQRWVSNTEIQLGLGTIIDTDLRTVSIYFAAGDETRTYARMDAPLTRIIYAPGETVNTVAGQSVIIDEVIETDGLVAYHAHDCSGKPVHLAEQELDHFVQFNRPAERLFSGQIDPESWFELRYQTIEQLNRLSHDPLNGLTGCRTALIPHQLYIAHEVANRYAPRVLLADEVGLGKTIEAGLIIHHQLLNERAQRVLIIVPENLQHQWLVEMLRRFNLMFSLFDPQRCQAITEHQQDNELNPFLTEQLVICSLEFLNSNELWAQQALDGEWDMLVVDEAHHLQWSPEEASDEYLLIQKLAYQVQGLLLLTATPEQLGVASHFARLHLLDPDRFPDLDTFVQEEQGYQRIAHAIDALLGNEAFDNTTHRLLEQVLLEQPATQTVSENKPIQTALKQLIQNNNAQKQQQARQWLIQHMLDRHGTGRVLFRNTRSAIQGFPQRQVFFHPQPLPDDYEQCIVQFSQELKTQSENPSENNQADVFSSLVLYPELLYQLAHSNHLADQAWYQLDPRVKWLAEWLLDIRSQADIDKVLVITANARTAVDLAEALHRHRGIHCATFHENMSLLERDRSAAFFADMENGSPVLICSEIGSEGRNFQFAHKMVLFDLPLNPDLLEQRIGRLDRIGQTDTIQIHIPFLSDSAQEILCHWYHHGLNAFEKTCPMGHTVFEQVQPQLYPLLMQPQWYNDLSSNEHWLQLLEKTQTLHHTLEQALHDGRDKLLEYNSCRQPQADNLLTQAEHSDAHSSIYQYMNRLFDAFGIEHNEHSAGSYIIQPGEHMISQFPGLPDDGMTITYQRDIALAYEDQQFFTWEHPMVRTAMDMVHSSEMGNTAISTLELRKMELSIRESLRLKPGTLLMECLFILDTSSHHGLHASRYLPATRIRILLDEHGQEISSQLPHEAIPPSSEAINKQTAQQIISIKEDTLRKMIKQAEQCCSRQTPQVLSEAVQSSEALLNNEINRLQALAEVNPAIRPEEIRFYQQQQVLLQELFEHIQPRLDALRLIIVT